MAPSLLRPSIFDPLPWMRCGMALRERLGGVCVSKREMVRGLAARVSVGRAAVVIGQQVHGARMAWAGSHDSAANGDSVRCVADRAPGRVEEVADVDALATDQVGVFLAVFTADCVPIVLGDPQRRTIAVVHAGREGTRLRIAQRAVEALCRRGSRPGDLRAWLAPAICPSHYEVSRDMANDFAAAFPEWTQATGVVKGRRLNLAEANRLQLTACGLAPGNIELDGRCTYEHPDLFESYRRDGEGAGRMITFAVISE